MQVCITSGWGSINPAGNIWGPTLKQVSLQRPNTANLKHIFPEKELRGPNFHIPVSVRFLYIPTIGLPILLQSNMWIDPGNMIINRSQTHEAENGTAQFLY
jgi:hypothetical protein